MWSNKIDSGTDHNFSLGNTSDNIGTDQYTTVTCKNQSKISGKKLIGIHSTTNYILYSEKKYIYIYIISVSLRTVIFSGIKYFIPTKGGYLNQ